MDLLARVLSGLASISLVEFNYQNLSALSFILHNSFLQRFEKTTEFVLDFFSWTFLFS